MGELSQEGTTVGEGSDENSNEGEQKSPNAKVALEMHAQLKRLKDGGSDELGKRIVFGGYAGIPGLQDRVSAVLAEIPELLDPEINQNIERHKMLSGKVDEFMAATAAEAEGSGAVSGPVESA